jgi:nucleotide-binding universal stress UspA family protein
MIKRLLVPLDGSALAESALVVAGDLAEALSGVLVLARVVPPPAPGRFYAPNLLEQVEEAQAKEAKEYLTSVAARLREDRLAVETKVAKGEAALTIVRLAAREQCQVIVMGSHGMGGVGWQVFGSVAQKVLHSSPLPVLIVRPPPEELERDEEAEEELSDIALLHEMTYSAGTKEGG